MEAHDHSMLKWALGILSTAVGWLFVAIHKVRSRADSAYDKASESRLVLAERHYTKLEVDHLVREAVKPIHDKLEDIGEDVKYLVRKKSDSRRDD